MVIGKRRGDRDPPHWRPRASEAVGTKRREGFAVTAEALRDALGCDAVWTCAVGVATEAIETVTPLAAGGVGGATGTFWLNPRERR